MNGTVSGEHGLGWAKRAQFSRQFQGAPADLQLGVKAWQKEFNTTINRIRYVPERAIANLKTWRILYTDYRRPTTLSGTQIRHGGSTDPSGHRYS